MDAEILVRADGAGAVHELLGFCHEGRGFGSRLASISRNPSSRRSTLSPRTRGQSWPIARPGASADGPVRRALRVVKRLDEFRFEDNPTINRATIASLAEGRWIEARESVILIGESGTGKTHLVSALALCACSQGRRVRFTTLAGLANELIEAQSEQHLARAIGRWGRYELIVLDELGYLALPEGAAELVFQVISERNERGALITTTNLPFSEWGKVFSDPRLAKAVVDRC